MSGVRMGDELDVTPAFTFTTIQFSSDVLNTIIASLITVFILVNIGSAVSKLVYFTRTTAFSYKSWLRAFIFANSDDPLRVLAWLARKYVYRDPSWNRYENRKRPSRLFLPLLARAIILIASVASVAVTVPSVRDMEGCVNNDYFLTYDPSIKAIPERVLRTQCVDVPLSTDRGQVTSTAAYCVCLDSLFPQDDDDPPSTRVKITPDTATGRIFTQVANKTIRAAYYFYVEWKPANSSLDGRTFRSDLTRTLDLTAHADLILDIARMPQFGGVAGCEKITSTETDSDGIVSFDLNCEVKALEILPPIEAYLRSAMKWQRLKRGVLQSRIELQGDSLSGSQTETCPLEIKITRPLVNIVPLTVMLVIWVIINIIVSFAARRHGNALDAGFHVIREALGHDCTSNPLEKCTEREEKTRLPLRKWRCGTGGAHYGFIGRAGDVPVEEFDENTIVSGCARVAVELDRARRLDTAPAGFAPPGISTSSMGSRQQSPEVVEQGMAWANANNPTN